MTNPLPSTFQEALRGIQDAPFLKTRRYQEQQWRADRKGAMEEILFFERLLVRRMKAVSVPVFAAEVMRSQARQKELYEDGFSKVAEYGPHTRGAAVDIIHSIKGWDIPQKAWSLIGHIGKEIIAQEGLKMRWGGDWKFYDPAHWEMVDWKDQPPF
ncbi:hypothetical protein [Flyfo microvirus Tbat2_98]|nr:hypothetical protein [Flyfo microvirus Tbat2_98]